MLFWIIVALLMAIVLPVVLLPLLRSSNSDEADGAADVAVYKDQLSEIAADLERGLIGSEEAQAARTEISRRLLKQSTAGGGNSVGGKPQSDGLARAMLLVTAVFIPLAAVVLYLTKGSPSLPGQPYAARISTSNPTSRLDVLVARAESRLRANPKDGMGWDVLAPIYLRQRRFDRAAEAYARAMDLMGESPKRLSGLAAARVSLDNGVVSEGTKKLFQRLLVLQPGRADAQFWLAKALEQDGKLADAAAAYRKMLKDAPEEAAWRGMVEGQLAQLQQRLNGGSGGPSGSAVAKGNKQSGPAVAGGDDRGPSAADVVAAKNMSAGDRSKMIDQMVANLAERLKNNGKDLPGWQKLVRAYVVLGKNGEAKQALKEARKNFAGDGQAQAQLDALEKQFRLGT